jgi:hypothetical protein
MISKSDHSFASLARYDFLAMQTMHASQQDSEQYIITSMLHCCNASADRCLNRMNDDTHDKAVSTSKLGPVQRNMTLLASYAMLPAFFICLLSLLLKLPLPFCY